MNRIVVNTVLAALFLCLAPLGATAQEVYRVGAPKFADISTLPMHTALARDVFKTQGINFELVSVRTPLVNAALTNGDIDSHIFLSPAFVPQMRGGVCSKLAMALSSSIPAGLVSTGQALEQLSGNTAILGVLGGMHEGLMTYEMRSRNISDVNYIAGGRTLARVTRMFNGDGTATFVYQPFLGIVRHMQGVNVLLDIGEFVQFPADGLVVACDSFEAPRAALHQRVVTTLQNEATWLRNPANKDATLALIKQIMGVEAVINRFNQNADLGGKPRNSVTADAVTLEIYNQFLAVGGYQRLDDSAIVRAIEIITGGKPADIGTFADQRWVQ